MGNDKTPLTDPQTISFEGIFEPDNVYSSLKDFLEANKNYDLGESMVSEKRKGDTLSLETEIEAMNLVADHMSTVITCELELNGKDQIVVDDNGVEHRYINGSAKLTIYSFLVQNDNAHAHKSPVSELFTKIYQKYFNKSEMDMIKNRAVGDVNDTITRFKQLTNMTVSLK